MFTAVSVDYLVPVLLVLPALLALWKGAGVLLRQTLWLSERSEITELSLGLSLLALVATLPELLVVLLAGARGDGMEVYASVTGSSIFNLFFLAGLFGLLRPLKFRNQSVWKELPFLIVATLLVFFLLNDQLLAGGQSNALEPWEARVLLAALAGYLLYVFTNHKKPHRQQPEDPDSEASGARAGLPGKERLRNLLLIPGASLAICMGALLLMQVAVELAESADFNNRGRAIVFLATGSGLPELFICREAFLHKKNDLVTGCLLGSMLLNLLLVLPAGSLYGALGYPRVLNFDFNFYFFGLLLLFFSMFTGGFKKLDRWEAFLFLAFSLVYFHFIVVRGQG